MKRRRCPRPMLRTACTPPSWCVDCGINTTPCTVSRRRGRHACPQHHGWEYYMVGESTWVEAEGPMSPGGFLCIGCPEQRLGRRLTPADFPDMSLNRDSTCDSERLLDRKERLESPRVTPTKGAVMATKRSSSTSNPYTPSPGSTQKLGDFLKAPGSSAKPPVAPSKSTGPLPRNTRKGAKR